MRVFRFSLKALALLLAVLAVSVPAAQALVPAALVPARAVPVPAVVPRPVRVAVATEARR